MYVDHITLVLGNFDAIAHLERATPHEKRPAGEIRERVFERDRNAGGHDAEERGE